MHRLSQSLVSQISASKSPGILAGEVLLGAFLLLLAGIIHRRYRWRSERSWVLFDWDVVAEKTPPKPFSFVSRFGLGPKHVSRLHLCVHEWAFEQLSYCYGRSWCCSLLRIEHSAANQFLGFCLASVEPNLDMVSVC